MEPAHNIFLFENIMGVNSFWTTDEEGNIAIIDTGMPKSEKKIAAQIKASGKKLEDVKFIIITHSDIDHSGSAAALKELTGAKIAIHKADADKVRGNMKLKSVRGFITPFFNFFMHFIKFRPFEPDIILEDGDEIAGFKILHTPGHTEGSITLYKPGKIAITGDTILGAKNNLPKGPMKTMTLDMDKAKDSIKKISSLDFDIMLPGHGNPVTSDASIKIRKLLTV